MRHHTRKFVFGVASQNKTGVYIEEATGQRHGIDLVRVKDPDRERHLSVRVAHNVLTNTIHVLDDHRISHEVRRLFDLHRILLAVGDFPVCREPISHATTPNITGSDSLDVVFASLLDMGVQSFTRGRDRVSFSGCRVSDGQWLTCGLIVGRRRLSVGTPDGIMLGCAGWSGHRRRAVGCTGLLRY